MTTEIDRLWNIERAARALMAYYDSGDGHADWEKALTDDLRAALDVEEPSDKEGRRQLLDSLTRQAQALGLYDQEVEEGGDVPPPLPPPLDGTNPWWPMEFRHVWRRPKF